MRKRGSGHQNKGAEGREMGFIGLITHPKSGKNRRKGQSFFAIFRACKTASFVDIKHGKTTPKPVFTIIYNTDYQYIAIIPHSTSTITSPLRQTHYAMD